VAEKLVWFRCEWKRLQSMHAWPGSKGYSDDMQAEPEPAEPVAKSFGCKRSSSCRIILAMAGGLHTRYPHSPVAGLEWCWLPVVHHAEEDPLPL
jgi:hypothetical protein